MVRENNKIPLYEALKRKKEADSLNKAASGQGLPQQKPKLESKFQLKMTLPQVKQTAAQTVKPLTKPAVRPQVILKGVNFKKDRQPSKVLEFCKGILQDRVLFKWVIVGAVVVVLSLVVYSIAFKMTRTNEPVAGSETGKKTPVPEKPTPAPVEKPAEVLTAKDPEPIKKPDPAGSGLVKKEEPQLPSEVVKKIQEPPKEEKRPEPAKVTPVGDNAIVIVAYTKKDDLVPVQSYFKQNGIETEVIQRGSYYLLITKDRYENPEKSGSDGNRAKQTIKRLGAKYKAPEGFERFGTTPFQDIYGMKVK